MNERPDRVRMSLAAAMALGLRSGRSYRDARTACVNLLLDYPTPCFSNCAYCGLARDRAEDGSFIRVEWPAFPTGDVIERIRRRAALGNAGVGRVCISMVENRRALGHAAALCESVRGAAPVSVLIHPNRTGEDGLELLKDSGADMIGIGLDGATQAVFERTRPGLDWEMYLDAARSARRVFGPRKVNCHVVVGLGESDRDVVAISRTLASDQIATYLFCFYPEDGSRLARRVRPTLTRWRRLQLALHLLDRGLAAAADLDFDDRGALRGFGCAGDAIGEAVASGEAFRTHGCPDASGSLACNRPFGSYRPGESFRDFPFSPGPADIARIRRELRLG